MTEGKFIVLEGPDGSGKSTQARLLVEALGKRGIPVDHLRDPGSTAVGDAIRTVLLGGLPIHPAAETFLFLASRAQLVEERIRPALAAGRAVVCERFVASTLVYQGIAAGLPPAALERLRIVIESSAGGLVPDLLAVLDVDPEAGLARIAGEGRPLDRIEKRGADHQRRVREGYHRVVSGTPGARLLPPGPVAEVHRALLALVEGVLGGR